MLIIITYSCYFYLLSWSFHSQAITRLSPHVLSKWSKQLLFMFLANGLSEIDLKKASSILLKVKTEQEEIFLMFLGRQLNNLHDFNLKLLKRKTTYVIYCIHCDRQVVMSFYPMAVCLLWISLVRLCITCFFYINLVLSLSGSKFQSNFCSQHQKS